MTSQALKRTIVEFQISRCVREFKQTILHSENAIFVCVCD